jgi:hypothetical protein
MNFFDNYYTSLPLAVELRKIRFHSVGIFRRNRLPNCSLPDEKAMKKDLRGNSYKRVTNIDGKEVSTTLWKDSKLVHLLSTFSGEQLLTEVH